MSNILLIKYSASISGVHIRMDSSKGRAIIVEHNNHIIKFQVCCDGLYYYHTANKFISHVNSYSFLTTVKDNKEYFRTSEIQGSDEASKVQQEISCPSTSHFKYIVSKQLLGNFKVKLDNIIRAELIYTTRENDWGQTKSL